MSPRSLRASVRAQLASRSCRGWTGPTLMCRPDVTPARRPATTAPRGQCAPRRAANAPSASSSACRTSRRNSSSRSRDCACASGQRRISESPGRGTACGRLLYVKWRSNSARSRGPRDPLVLAPGPVAVPVLAGHRLLAGDPTDPERDVLVELAFVAGPAVAALEVAKVEVRPHLPARQRAQITHTGLGIVTG
jgi:hypothetical protein